MSYLFLCEWNTVHGCGGWMAECCWATKSKQWTIQNVQILINLRYDIFANTTEVQTIRFLWKYVWLANFPSWIAFHILSRKISFCFFFLLGLLNGNFQCVSNYVTGTLHKTQALFSPIRRQRENVIAPICAWMSPYQLSQHCVPDDDSSSHINWPKADLHQPELMFIKYIYQQFNTFRSSLIDLPQIPKSHPD